MQPIKHSHFVPVPMTSLKQVFTGFSRLIIHSSPLELALHLFRLCIPAKLPQADAKIHGCQFVPDVIHYCFMQIILIYKS